VTLCIVTLGISVGVKSCTIAFLRRHFLVTSSNTLLQYTAKNRCTEMSASKIAKGSVVTWPLLFETRHFRWFSSAAIPYNVCSTTGLLSDSYASSGKSYALAIGLKEDFLLILADQSCDNCKRVCLIARAARYIVLHRIIVHQLQMALYKYSWSSCTRCNIDKLLIIFDGLHTPPTQTVSFSNIASREDEACVQNNGVFYTPCQGVKNLTPLSYNPWLPVLITP